MKPRRGRTGSPGARFIDPAVLARIDNLELLARSVVQGFIGGLHRSSYLGASVNFAEHRAYMPGDDVRRIDWRLYARSDRFYVKEYEADSNANFTVLLDTSRSMGYSSQGVSKLDYGRYLAACLGYFANKQRDRVGLTTFDTDVRRHVPASAKQFDLVLRTLGEVEADGSSDLRRPMLQVAEALRRSGIAVLISDLYEDPETVLSAVKGLEHRGHDLIVFHVLDPEEIEFNRAAAANFEDMESGETLPVVPQLLREQYRALVTEHIDRLTSVFGGQGIDYTLLDTSKPLDYALFRYLSARQKTTRSR